MEMLRSMQEQLGGKRTKKNGKIMNSTRFSIKEVAAYLKIRFQNWCKYENVSAIHK